MARRSRKQRPTAPQQRPAQQQPDAMRRGYARGRERDEAMRRTLTPLEPGERPAPLVVAASVAALLGLTNLALFAAGVKVSGEKVEAKGVIFLSVLLLGAAWGIWTKKYTAVIGFEVLLGITITFAALSLLVASNLAAVVVCVAIIGLGGWLFWKLVRIMGRLQVPARGRRIDGPR